MLKPDGRPVALQVRVPVPPVAVALTATVVFFAVDRGPVGAVAVGAGATVQVKVCESVVVFFFAVMVTV
jgi:hypothetical protein